MKNSIRNIFAALFVLCAPFVLANAGEILNTSLIMTLQPVAPALNDLDLDARDEFNRPIRSVAAKRNFQNLWNSSLAGTLLENLTPARAQLFALLKSIWDACRSVLSGIFKTVHTIFKAILSSIHVSRFSTQFQWLRLNGNPFVRGLEISFATHIRALIISTTRILR